MAHEAVLSIITIKFNKSPVPHGSKIRRGLRGFEGGVASKRPSEASPDQNLANPSGSYGRTSSVKQNAAREREQNPNTPNLTRVSIMQDRRRKFRLASPKNSFFFGGLAYISFTIVNKLKFLNK